MANSTSGIVRFGTVDYAVFGIMLFVSIIIGIYYALSGGKQKTTVEFLLANRKMMAIPIGLSLLASFMSAITILGVPAEIYTFGVQYWMIIISYVILFPIVALVFVPVFRAVDITSSYEVWLFQWLIRNNTLVRICLSKFGHSAWEVMSHVDEIKNKWHKKSQKQCLVASFLFTHDMQIDKLMSIIITFFKLNRLIINQHIWFNHDCDMYKSNCVLIVVLIFMVSVSWTAFLPWYAVYWLCHVHHSNGNDYITVRDLMNTWIDYYYTTSHISILIYHVHLTQRKILHVLAPLSARLRGLVM